MVQIKCCLSGKACHDPPHPIPPPSVDLSTSYSGPTSLSSAKLIVPHVTQKGSPGHLPCWNGGSSRLDLSIHSPPCRRSVQPRPFILDKCSASTDTHQLSAELSGTCLELNLRQKTSAKPPASIGLGIHEPPGFSKHIVGNKTKITSTSWTHILVFNPRNTL